MLKRREYVNATAVNAKPMNKLWRGGSCWTRIIASYWCRTRRSFDSWCRGSQTGCEAGRASSCRSPCYHFLSKQTKSHLETNHTPFFEKSTDCSLRSRHLVVGALAHNQELGQQALLALTPYANRYLLNLVCAFRPKKWIRVKLSPERYCFLG